MDLDKIKKHIQNFFDEKTTIIIGSGLSCAEGITGMKDLAVKICEEFKKLDFSQEAINIEKEKIELIEKLSVENSNLEEVLLSHSLSEILLKEIRRITFNFICEKDQEIYCELLNNKRILKFSSFISRFNTSKYSVDIITTNYDRLIEYACESNEIWINNHFYGKYFPIFEPDFSKNSLLIKDKKIISYYPHINIFKPHGCLNWKRLNDKIIICDKQDIGEPLIITPGKSKYESGYERPFDFNRQKANEVIDNSKRYIFVGYGFNDSHLETHIKSPNNLNKPIIIVTYSLSESAQKLVDDNPNIMAIHCLENKETEVIWKNEKLILENNIWNIDELVKEVFNE